MTNKTQKSEPRRSSLIPILIVGSIVAVLCMITICVLLILLFLPAIGVEVRNPLSDQPDPFRESSLAPGESPSVEAGTPLDESYERALEMAVEWEGLWVN